MPPVAGLEAGRLITENVRLRRLLGEGGMGSVWIADHLTLRTQVAVKFMSTELVQDAAAVARFTREATAAAQVKSPHIVQTYDHGVTSDGIPYIVMELLEGEDLSRRVERSGPLLLADASRMLTQVCKALTKAHNLGIVHRDIKPDNIFLVANEDELFVKVFDFGIAKRTEAEPQFGMTSTGALVGTPYYMSPEQLHSSKNVDFRADLWSLGVVAYYCLTAQVPFDAENFASLCIAIDKGAFAPPSTHRSGLPAALDFWFEKALARDPAGRFSSAREFAETFAAALQEPAQIIPESRADVEASSLHSVPLHDTVPEAPPPHVVMPNLSPTAGLVPVRESAKQKSGPTRWLALAGVALALVAFGGFLLFLRGKGEATPSKDPPLNLTISKPVASESTVATTAPAASSAPPLVVVLPTASTTASVVASSTATPRSSAVTSKTGATKTKTPPATTGEPDRGF